MVKYNKVHLSPLSFLPAAGAKTTAVPSSKYSAWYSMNPFAVSGGRRRMYAGEISHITDDTITDDTNIYRVSYRVTLKIT